MTSLLLALLAVQQAAETGRQGRPCRVEIDSVGGLWNQREIARDTFNIFAGGGVFAHCEGTGSSLTADSVAWYGREGRFDMVGNVRIRDDLMNLDATTARYFTRQERLEAHRNVVAVNRRTGTVLRGPNLTYFRAAEGVRDTSELFASSRPTIHYRTEPDSGEPHVIVADRVRMKGDDRMWAGGQVTVDRSDMAARADSMMMDETAGAGLLVGRPRVEGKGERAYTLTGVRIELEIDSSEVRLVKALGRGQATGEDWRLTSDTIHLALQDRKLQQSLAWGDSVRPRAVSTQHTVQGDSLALDTPNEVLTELRAFGRALSTSKRDTSAAAELDWITGDTLVARFVQVADTGGGGGGGSRGGAGGAGGAGGGTKSELRELVARGSARSLTHLSQDGDPSGPPNINYSRGTSIAVTMRGDRIDRVLVSGRADGVHLERLPPPPPPPPADSTKARTRP